MMGLQKIQTQAASSLRAIARTCKASLSPRHSAAAAPMKPEPIVLLDATPSTELRLLAPASSKELRWHAGVSPAPRRPASLRKSPARSLRARSTPPTPRTRKALDARRTPPTPRTPRRERAPPAPRPRAAPAKTPPAARLLKASTPRLLKASTPRRKWATPRRADARSPTWKPIVWRSRPKRDPAFTSLSKKRNRTKPKAKAAAPPGAR